MTIENQSDVHLVRQELANRFRQYRIAFPMTQRELAEASMVSLRSISRFENGEEITLSSLIRIMQALGIGENMEALVPDPALRPSYYLEQAPQRKRAGRTKENRTDWKWGDEA